MNINTKAISEAIIIVASVSAGVVGFNAGCRAFEKSVPSTIQKVAVMKDVAKATLSDDDEYEDEYEDDDED